MKHPMPFEFSNSEVADFDPYRMQLYELSQFLWNDPRPHAESRFDMGHVALYWDEFSDDPVEALSRCGTAACACGWEIFKSGDNGLYERAGIIDGLDAKIWMFGGSWVDHDNSPFGASFRIRHRLKHDDRSLYSGYPRQDMTRHYPADPFWLEKG